MPFYTQKELIERAKKYKNFNVEDNEDPDREMNDYEQELMKQFEENDREIDEILEEIIKDLENIKYHG